MRRSEAMLWNFPFMQLAIEMNRSLGSPIGSSSSSSSHILLCVPGRLFLSLFFSHAKKVPFFFVSLLLLSEGSLKVRSNDEGCCAVLWVGMYTHTIPVSARQLSLASEKLEKKKKRRRGVADGHMQRACRDLPSSPPPPPSVVLHYDVLYKSLFYFTIFFFFISRTT